ncbi:hypothetical protein SKAU_G00234110 [Synaphobranchus kaupii]|uniref:guanylate cyclase n=1 Tax=Synaphobranchus kaupii TaxID=118154 RepID=A0A9Q1F6C2_SYNKA|nr:hypothetical protein SKAU_G00234110 [Synaphobranchus kaupii]
MWSPTNLALHCTAMLRGVCCASQLKVKQTGVNIQRFVPGLQTMDVKLDEYFSIVHPQVTFNIDSIKKFINSQFVLKTRSLMVPQSSQSQSMLKLRGKLGRGSRSCSGPQRCDVQARSCGHALASTNHCPVALWVSPERQRLGEHTLREKWVLAGAP